MKLLSISHIALMVADMEKSLDFYCRCLGFQRVFDITFGDMLRSLEENQDFDNPMIERLQSVKELPFIVYLQIVPGQFLELYYNHEQLPQPPGARQARGFQHLALQVEDIQAARTDVLAAGYPIVSDPELGADYSWQMWLADPDGIPIEVMQYTDQSWQYTQAEAVLR